jgi:branched-chain amino acid transport system substrate-binding protein
MDERANIFICYRRLDSAAYARSLRDDLRRRFGDHGVFMDLGIAPGEDFVQHVEGAIASCAVLLVLIGREWLNVPGEDGRPRLDDHDDLVRLEIATALQRGVVVIPVLVRGARMPKAHELPAPLAALARRNALELRDDNRWDDDVARLVETLESRLEESSRVATTPRKPPANRVDQTTRASRLSGRRIPRQALLGVAALPLLAIASALIPGGGSEAPNVRVGAIYSLSGKNEAAGQTSLEGVRFAIDYVNSDRYPDLGLPLRPGRGLPGLHGAKLELAVQDVASDRCKAQPAFDRLVTRDHAAAVIGAYESTITLQAISAANRRGIPLVNDTATAPSLTEPDGNTAPSRVVCGTTEEDPTPSPWFSRVGANDGQFAELFMRFIEARKARGVSVSKIGILYESHDIFGEVGAGVTTKLAKRRGIEVHLYPYDSRAAPATGRCPLQKLVSDMDKQVRRLQADAPDAVFALSYLPDAAVAVQTMHKLGYVPPALLAYGAGYADPGFVARARAGNVACGLPRTDPDGVITRSVGWLQNRGAAAKRLADLFQQRFGHPMTDIAARSFTAMMTLARAIDDAGSARPIRIQSALRALRLPDTGTILPADGIRFDSNGQNVDAPGVLLQIQSGKYEVVYPRTLATSHADWPMRATPG